MNVLSIQSTVAFGHVGNAAAQLPLQLLGHEVWPIDTVRFSNHPGHGRFRGTVTPPAEVAALIEGIEALGLLDRVDAVLSGYLGDPGTAAVVARTVAAVKQANPKALYLCDPVMGDADRLFVDPAIPELMRDRLIPLADIVTPNPFELALLAGTHPTTFPALREAAYRLMAPHVVVTGIALDDIPAHELHTLMVYRGSVYRLRVPRLPRRFDGAGDCFAALMLGHLLNGNRPRRALERAASNLQAILEATGDARDLALVAARTAIPKPPRLYSAEQL
jgi:pyridoxine kinase